jgi:hypothetical protein
MSKKFIYIKVLQILSYGRQRLLIQRYFTCVLTLYCFCWKLKKTHWWQPTKCAILHFLIKYVLCKWRPRFKYVVCKDIDFPRKKNKNMCVNQLFFLSLWMNYVTQRHTVALPKNKRRIHGVLSSLGVAHLLYFFKK